MDSGVCGGGGGWQANRYAYRKREVHGGESEISDRERNGKKLQNRGQTK